MTPVPVRRAIPGCLSGRWRGRRRGSGRGRRVGEGSDRAGRATPWSSSGADVLRRKQRGELMGQTRAITTAPPPPPDAEASQLELRCATGYGDARVLPRTRGRLDPAWGYAAAASGTSSLGSSRTNDRADEWHQ
jgi:hypothetical protein